MADLDFDGFGPGEGGDMRPADAAPGFGRLVNLLGAALSLALMGGLAVWGYELLMRDVTGIPVVQALDGPMRVQPDDPGGERAAHQGLAVNRIAAEGEAAPPAAEIVLAPRSTDLEPEDMAQGVLRGTPALAPAPDTGSDSALAGAARPQPALATDPVAAAILAAATGVMTAEAEISGSGLVQIVPASVPGPARSLRPRARPTAFSTLLPGTPGERDPASLAPGTRLVQFGAYDSPEQARAAWSALSDSFGALMSGKDRVVEPAETGGRSFYRLRAAGFEDLADARRFCAAFVAERTDCIPVLAR